MKTVTALKSMDIHLGNSDLEYHELGFSSSVVAYFLFHAGKGCSLVYTLLLGNSLHHKMGDGTAGFICCQAYGYLRRAMEMADAAISGALESAVVQLFFYHLNFH